LVFEAFEPYWRKIPSVKRLVSKVIPEETTRLAALKMGEVDIVYAINGGTAQHTGADALGSRPDRRRTPATRSAYRKLLC
jgi:ABC-type transport system substrate-binding protein